VHIPKAAGTSFVSWIEQQQSKLGFDFENIGHQTIQEAHISRNIVSYDYAMCITRNTYARMSSLYHWAPKKIHKSLKRVSRDDNYNMAARWQLNQDKSAWNKGIAYFIDYLRDRNDSATKSQLEYIKECNLVARQENLAEDLIPLHKMFDTRGAPGFTKHVINKPVSDVWSKEFKRVIKYHFADELDHFKYLPPL